MGGVAGVWAVMKKTRAGPRKAAWNLAAVSRATAIEREIRFPLHKRNQGRVFRGIRNLTDAGPKSGSASDRSAGQPPRRRESKSGRAKTRDTGILHQRAEHAKSEARTLDRADSSPWEKICEITSASVFWPPPVVRWLACSGWLQFRGNAGVRAPSSLLAEG